MVKIVDRLTDEQIIEILNNSTSFSDFEQKLGYSSRGGKNKKVIMSRLDKMNINVSDYFTLKINTLRDDEEIFQEDSTVARCVVKRRILQKNLIPYECAICGNKGEWMGKKLTLILDHINGISNDHRLHNLRFVCPNCDNQLDTYCGRNKQNTDNKRYKQIKVCKKCGKPVSNRATFCKECYTADLIRNSKIIEKERLENLLLSGVSRVKIGEMFGVSETTVRKWCKKYKIDLQRREER